MIPESFIEELKFRSDIEQIISGYTQLKRTGRTLKGLCPFHNEKKRPHLSSILKRFVLLLRLLRVGGDVVTFVRQAEKLEYVEALRFWPNARGFRCG